MLHKSDLCLHLGTIKVSNNGPLQRVKPLKGKRTSWSSYHLDSGLSHLPTNYAKGF